MRIIIKSEYVLVDDYGEMFDTATASTESDVNSKESVRDLFILHEEKVGKCEQRMRVQVDSLSSRIPDDAS